MFKKQRIIAITRKYSTTVDQWGATKAASSRDCRHPHWLHWPDSIRVSHPAGDVTSQKTSLNVALMSFGWLGHSLTLCFKCRFHIYWVLYASFISFIHCHIFLELQLQYLIVCCIGLYIVQVKLNFVHFRLRPRHGWCHWAENHPRVIKVPSLTSRNREPIW